MAKKIFEQFHLSLIERDQIDMFEQTMSRELWLRSIFEKNIEFRHAGENFYWVPKPNPGEFITGIIERLRTHTVLTPPDEGADEQLSSYYTGAVVVVDPANRPDGQQVAIHRNTQVGKPLALLSSLFNHLNAQSENQYTVYLKPLFSGASFWSFSQSHNNELEYVRFKFTVPNMIFGAGGKTKEGLRRLGEDTKAQEIDLRFQSRDGVKVDSTAVREGLEYGQEGNAIVTAKALNGARWSSATQQLTTTVESILNFAEASRSEAQEWLKRVLGRD